MFVKTNIRFAWLAVFITLSAVAYSHAAQLPQDEPYQVVLRDFIATLNEVDFSLAKDPVLDEWFMQAQYDALTAPAAPGLDTGLAAVSKVNMGLSESLTMDPVRFELPPEDMPEWQLYALTMMRASTPVGAALTILPRAFTLASIESHQGIMTPFGGDMITRAAWLSQWNYPGNPYYQSRPLLLRTFVAAAVDLMMTEQSSRVGIRSDFLGGTLIWLAYPLPKLLEVIPPEVAEAYRDGLKRIVMRLNRQGPVGQMVDMDLFAAVSMWYATRALPDDPEVAEAAEAYARRLFTNANYYDSAGFFYDRYRYDATYNGISIYFAAWAAAVSDWDFTREPIAQNYRLRKHLSLPDPDGRILGPSHMNARTSGDAHGDQWNWINRHVSAALVTDEAFYAIPAPPDPAQLRRTIGYQLADWNNEIKPTQPALPEPWSYRHWGQFSPAALDGITEQWYNQLVALHAEASDLLKLPFAKNETFFREFGYWFRAARQPDYGVIIYTGPSAGIGGAGLSAFWTPKTGSVLLGRRRGKQGNPGVDTPDEWRQWPVHTLSGQTVAGNVFSTAAVAWPKRETHKTADGHRVSITGEINNRNVLRESQDEPDATLAFERSFTIEPQRLAVAINLERKDPVEVTELYEVLPVFIRERNRHEDHESTQIEFQTRSGWTVPEDDRLHPDVTAVRITRYHFRHPVVFRFDRPRPVKLSPVEWFDGYMSSVTCRNIMIDLTPDWNARPTGKISLAWSYEP